MKKYYTTFSFLFFISHLLFAQHLKSDSTTILQHLYVVDLDMVWKGQITGLLYEVKDSSVVIISGRSIRSLKKKTLTEIEVTLNKAEVDLLKLEYPYSEIKAITVGKRKVLLKTFLTGLTVGGIAGLTGFGLSNNIYDAIGYLAIGPLAGSFLGWMSGTFLFKRRYRIKGDYAKFSKTKEKLKEKAVW